MPNSSTTAGPSQLPGDILDMLSHASTATITTQLFARGLRNQFLHGLRPASREHQHFVGEAFTLRYIPAREDVDVLSVFEDYEHPQRKAIESVPPGGVLVVDSRNEPKAASAGSILMTRLQVRGAVGFVSDGSVRDYDAICRMALSVFSRGAAATTNLALHHAADMQVPIGCAGVPVYPGDVMVADGDGVVCVPRYLAAQIASAAVQQDHLEDFILAKIARGEPLHGNYPPNEATRSAYADHAKRKDE